MVVTIANTFMHTLYFGIPSVYMKLPELAGESIWNMNYNLPTICCVETLVSGVHMYLLPTCYYRNKLGWSREYILLIRRAWEPRDIDKEESLANHTLRSICSGPTSLSGCNIRQVQSLANHKLRSPCSGLTYLSGCMRYKASTNFGLHMDMNDLSVEHASTHQVSSCKYMSSFFMYISYCSRTVTFHETHREGIAI